jgi:RNA polymerase sigma-70 factor, ECF subfamily
MIYSQPENPDESKQRASKEFYKPSMTAQTPPDELLMMQRVVARDQQALTELYDRFAALIYGMALRVLQDPALAEEATQDTFMKVWRQAEEWNPERGKLVSWLLTIARFTAIDRLRKDKRQSPASVEMDELLHLASGEGIPEQTALFDDALIQRLLHQLPSEQVEAIECAFFRGMSHTEIAAHLKQPLGTVKSRIRDGLHTLRGLWLQATE